MTAHEDTIREALPMSNEQSERLELLAGIHELDRLAEEETNPDTLERIRARKKALREFLQLTKAP